MEIIKETNDAYNALNCLILPGWLPKPISNAVLGRQSYITSLELSSTTPDDFLIYKASFLNILPAFTNEDTKEAWEVFMTISEEKTVVLAGDLFGIQLAKICVMELYNKNQLSIKEGDALLKAHKKLRRLLDQPGCTTFLRTHFHSLRRELDGSFNEAFGAWTKFKKENSDTSKYNNEFFPVSRKYKAINAEAVFFAKRLSGMVRDLFGKALNRHVAALVNAVFDTIYSGDDIINLTKHRKIQYIRNK